MTTTKENELSHSELQAVAQLESIKEMVAALECDYDRLEELRGERDDYQPDTDGPEHIWAMMHPDEATELAELAVAAGECESQEDAKQRIQEDALSVEVRSGWYTLDGANDKQEAAEFCILLCTGGPACRIIGELDRGQPSSARLQHQDWGTPWTEHITRGDDHDALLTYCQHFYFGD